MNSRPWCEQLRTELHQQGLPPSYIDRLVEELADHALDSQTESTSMDAQQACAKIGTATQLAAAARHEFDQRTFAGRHPWLTFIVGPIVFVPVLFVALIVGALGVVCVIASAGEWLMGDRWPTPSEGTIAQFNSWFVWCFDSYVRFIPFAVAAWIFCRWGQRNSMQRWALAACVIVAVIAGLFVEKSTPPMGDVLGSWTLGFTFRPNLRQLIQLLAPLAVAACFLLRLRRYSLPTSTTVICLLHDSANRA